MKTLTILGSTGSIGRQTLDIVRAFPSEFKVAALAAGTNLDLLTQQIQEFRPEAFFTPAFKDAPVHTTNFPGGVARFAPMEEMAAFPHVDTVVVATAGKAGLTPCLAALRHGKNVALANKEVLVMAGEIVMNEAAEHGAYILPVDSEHSALWQCLRGEHNNILRLILTASGGPFRNRTRADLERVTAKEALKHPTWLMGPKVTIDSATLMNKGMEIIEARWLFGVPLESIHVVVHPESIVHSMIEFVDGSVKAQLSYPDMRLPIQFALSFPERLPARYVDRLDFNRTRQLTFEEPDWSIFPCPKLAVESARRGGTYPAVLCAADDVAVALFLAGRIGFMDIPRIVEATLGKHNNRLNPSIQDIEDADNESRLIATEISGVKL
jgi:1-deoxy-D-xylulose-5-phosphate reductoisomerase